MTKEINLKVKTRWFAKGAKDAVKDEDVMIVVDTLRCSSVITTALESGASAIYPVASVEEAFRIKRSGQYNRPLLVGEINGIMVEGFDAGNSPTELLKLNLNGRSMVIRTSAGSQILAAITKLDNNVEAAIGCILNARAVADWAYNYGSKENKDISIICCGYQAKIFTLDDLIGAGAIIREIPLTVEQEAGARGACSAFERAASSLSAALNNSKSGRRLREIGQVQDIAFCSQFNKYNTVPIFDGRRIQALKV